MNVFTGNFFGHRIVDNPLLLERLLEGLIRKLLTGKNYVVFLVGRNGEFDQLVSSIVRRSKRMLRGDNRALVWVMPYLTAEYRNNEEVFRQYYDEIVICEEAAGKHFEAAFQIRNHCMIDRSDLVVFCVQRQSGGAWQTMHNAEKKGIPFLNLDAALSI